MSDFKFKKIDFVWGSAPDPAGGAYNAPPDPLAGFKGTYFWGEGGEGKGGERKVLGKGGIGEGEGRERSGGEEIDASGGGPALMCTYTFSPRAAI